MLALVVTIFSALPTRAEVSFNVNTTMDQLDQDLDDGVCQTSSGTCSLRAAVMQANNLTGSGSVFIRLPAGNYVLSLGNGLYFGNAAHPDRSIILSGDGAATTIIDSNQGGKLIH